MTTKPADDELGDRCPTCGCPTYYCECEENDANADRDEAEPDDHTTFDPDFAAW